MRFVLCCSLLLGLVAGCGNLRKASVAPVANPLPLPARAITDDEAARFALLNNAGFLELAADVGISQAELVQAKQLPNPTLSVLFPLNDKQLEYAAKLPLEAIWLRPRRVAAAQIDAARVEKLVTQSGLDLVRDVKVACADLRLAEQLVALGGDRVRLLENISKLAEARLNAGDVSEIEARSAGIDADAARAEVAALPRDVEAARESLRHLLGQSMQPVTVRLASAADPPSLHRGEPALVRQALAARPDLRAAGLAIDAEGERMGLAEAEIFTLTGILDGNGTGRRHEAGPGLEVTLPIFNQNQGGKALASARMEKAARHYAVVRDRIALEVRQARTRYLQAQEVRGNLRGSIQPALEDSIEQAEKAYAAGNVSYLFVLERSRQLHDVRVRAARATADWHRAAAELERALGSSVSNK